MKKTVIITSAIGLVVAGALAAIVFANGQAFTAPQEQAVQSDKQAEMPELKIGKYYYDGDGYDEFYLEILDGGKVKIVNPDLYDFFEQDIKKDYPDGNPADWADDINAKVALYTKETEYKFVYMPELDLKYWILLDWNGNFGYGFTYIDENTISWGERLGQFIYKG